LEFLQVMSVIIVQRVGIQLLLVLFPMTSVMVVVPPVVIPPKWVCLLVKIVRADVLPVNFQAMSVLHRMLTVQADVLLVSSRRILVSRVMTNVLNVRLVAIRIRRASPRMLSVLVDVLLVNIPNK
jgi:hypothetical protein